MFSEIDNTEASLLNNTDMAENTLRRRIVEEDKASESEAETLQRAANASDTDDRATINEDIAKKIGQDKPPDSLDQALSSLPPRWKNWVIRGIFTWLMIGGFALIIYGGPLALMLTTFLVQVKVRQTYFGGYTLSRNVNNI